MSNGFMMPANIWENVPGANLPMHDEDPEDDFAWLDAIDEDNCYMPIDILRPAKSLDFGSDGRTGSVTAWHELLQITAPHDTCGVVFVRGDFPDSAESILARAQRRNEKGTFGLTVRINEVHDHPKTGVGTTHQSVLELTPGQGFINLRWPCTRFSLVRNDQENRPEVLAAYTACSFAVAGSVFQVARITPVTHTSGSVSSSSSASSVKEGIGVDITVELGGHIRFGCSGSGRGIFTDRRCRFRDKYTEETPDEAEEDQYTLVCVSERHHQKLEMRLWVNRDPIDMRKWRHVYSAGDNICHERTHPQGAFQDRIHPFFASFPVTVKNESITIVAQLTLVNRDSKTNFTKQDVLSSSSVQNLLGVSDTSLLASYRLWSALLGEAPGKDAVQLNAIGRCIESVLSVSALPFSKTSGADEENHGDPVLRSISNSSSSQRARAVSAAGSTDYIALLRNIITPQVVDMESTFWQIRFLVKAAKFLNKATIREPPESATLADKANHRRLIAMLPTYQSRVVDALRKACHWILDIIPVLQASSSQDLHYGILPADVLSDPQIRWMGRNCQDPAGLIAQREFRRETRRDSSRGGHDSESSTRTAKPSPLSQKFKMRSQKWYGACIIWFLVREGPPRVLDTELKRKLWDRLGDMKLFNNEDNRTDTAILDDPYGCILRWYHSHSFAKICEWLAEENAARFSGCVIDLAKHKDLALHWQVKAEKSLRLFGQGRLRKRILGYDVANLAMVGTELGVSDVSVTMQGQSKKTCIEYSRDLIKSRPSTSVLNPGRSRVTRWDAHEIRSSAPRAAPWELSCLGHHVPVNLGIANNEEERVMEHCSEFLLSDYTFLGSIDQSNASMVSQWWDLTTSSVICARLLDDILQSLSSTSFTVDFTNPESLPESKAWAGMSRMSGYSRIDLPAPRPKGPSPEAMAPTPGRGPSQVGPVTAMRVPDDQSASDSFMDEFRQRIEDLIQNKQEAVFFWTHRLPRLLYHAETAVQSLEDTPSVFRLKQTRNVTVRRNIQKHFEQYRVGDPDWSLETVRATFTAASLRHISCIDFSLSADASDAPEISRSVNGGRVALRDLGFWKGVFGDEEGREGRGDQFFKLLKEYGGDTGLLDLYFLGEQTKHPSYHRFPKEFRDMLTEEAIMASFRDRYQDSLLRVLNDSIVDLGTKYRLLFLRDVSPIVLQALVYMWHPEGLDAFDNHLGPLSKFSDDMTQVSNGGDDMWITTITLSSWRLESQAENAIRTTEEFVEKGGGRHDKRVDSAARNDDDDGDDEEEEEEPLPPTVAAAQGVADFPPRAVFGNHSNPGNKNDGKKKKKKKKKKKRGKGRGGPRDVGDEKSQKLSKIRGLTISLVITGDPWGRYWTCTVINELIDEKKAARLSQEVQEVLQMFIHQQYTARSLVALLVTGYFCEQISVECENFSEQLDMIMGMDPMVLLKGIEWHKSDVALKKLKEMMWGLEALRVFDDKLARTLVQIKAAKTKMKNYLQTGTSIRHNDMTRDLERLVEDFDKRYTRLENAHSSISQRIEQGSRLREGMTSVISVEQNENISMLTWVTIAYLPLAFVAGVFSMGHHIVPDSAGWPEFGWLIVVFVIGTVMFALNLQTLIAKMRRLGILVLPLMEKSEKGVDVVVEPPPTESKSWGRRFIAALSTTSGLRRRMRRNQRGNEMEMEN